MICTFTFLQFKKCYLADFPLIPCPPPSADFPSLPYGAGTKCGHYGTKTKYREQPLGGKWHVCDNK